MNVTPESIIEKFYLFEQTVADTDQKIEVELEYVPKPFGKTSDYHSLILQLRRPGEMSFCDIVIEYRNGELLVHYADPTDMLRDESRTFRPLDDQPFCLKCGWAWSVHNGDGSCVEEN